MKKIITSLLACLGLWCATSAQVVVQQKNITLLSHIPYNDLCSDVAGYVSAGVEYAVIGHASGTSIISLANPASPVLVQEIPAISNTIWHEVDVYQHYAYIANEAGDGLRIIDLAGLPGTCAYKDTVIANMSTGHALMVSGDRLYIYGSDQDNGGASVLSLVDPWRPSHIGAYTATYVHDAYVRGDTCYMGDIYNGFMTMVDMRNPTAPVVLGTVQTPSAFTHNSWLNDAGNICFTTDEVNAAYVTAYDVSNPASISEVGRYRSSLSNGQSVPHNVKVRNDFLVTAYYKDGVNIADASRPYNMIEVGYYDTNPQDGAGFDGNWGLECYLPSGTIVACDMSQGVFVLAPTYVRACYLEGQVTDAVSGNPIPGASITMLGTNVVDATDALGDYATGIADAGNYAVRYSKYGYRDSTINLTMANGVLNIQNIALSPSPHVPLTVQVLDQVSGNPIPNAQVELLEITNQVKTTYVADANGMVHDPSFLVSNYELIAGDWGHVSASLIANVTAQANQFTISLPKGYYDDFVFDFGWTVSGSALDGAWETGEPVGTPFDIVYANPELDLPNDFGDACMMTGNGGGGAFDHDVDNGTTTVTSPVMDLSNYTNPWLIFDYWFFTSSANGTPGFRDSLLIQISNGLETKMVWARRDLQQPLWVTDTIQIASYLAFTNNMQVSISCSDHGFDNIVEAAIDRVRIEDQNFVAIQPMASPQPSLLVYPNPAHDLSFLQYDLQDAQVGTIRILDLDGRLLQSIALTGAKGIVKMELALPQGMYFAVLEANGKRLGTQKIIRY